MARRANTKTKPWWIVAVLFVVVGVIGTTYYLFQDVSDPYRTIPALDVKAYMDNANALRGNVYKVEGRLHNSLSWSPAEGRLFSIHVGEEDDLKPLPVLVPAEFNHVNLQKGQMFRMKIEIIKGGIIQALDLNKN